MKPGTYVIGPGGIMNKNDYTKYMNHQNKYLRELIKTEGELLVAIRELPIRYQLLNLMTQGRHIQVNNQLKPKMKSLRNSLNRIRAEIRRVKNIK